MAKKFMNLLDPERAIFEEEKNGQFFSWRF
jgi:hypothetical protein